MALSNEQYDALMRQYNHKQARNNQIVSYRTDEVYAAIPDLARIDEEVSKVSISSITAIFDGKDIAEAAAAAVNESPITWLNLTQKGNLLTFQDNTGMVYSGKITGASCPNADNEGYITAAHIRFTYEATSTSNSKIKLSGTLSGDWSGGSSKTSGTLSNRTIDASYTRGRGATQFMAVSGSVTIYATGVSAGI